jgi:hypothetical protein
MLQSIQRLSSMAKARSTRTKAAARAPASRRGTRPRWVRKSVVIDQRKLDAVQRLYGAATEKEALDQALDSILFSREVLEGVETMRRLGGIDGIDDVLKGR